MICIQTERLIILAIPSQHTDLNLKNKSTVRGLVKRHTVLDQANLSNLDAAGERSLLTQSNLNCACFLREELDQVGYVSSRWRPELGICYVGYSVEPEYRGHGYATEATRAVCQWLLTGPDVKAIVSETFSDAADSLKVMERVGMQVIDANLGPGFVRRALVKPGAEIDLVEHEVITLKPFQYSRARRFRNLLEWQMKRPRDFIPLIIFLITIFASPDQVWVLGGIIGATASFGYLAYRLFGYLQGPSSFTSIQLRGGGLFYANRLGFGDVTPWKTFTRVREPKQGGLEIWNGYYWYWIPPEAFADVSVAEAKEFIASHSHNQ